MRRVRRQESGYTLAPEVDLSALDVRRLAAEIGPHLAEFLRPPERPSVPFGALVHRWLDAHLRRIAASDHATVRGLAERLVDGLGDAGPLELTKSRAEAFLVGLRSRRGKRGPASAPVSERTRNRCRLVGMQVLELGIADGDWRGPNAFAQVPAWRPPKKRRAVLTTDEARRLLWAVAPRFRCVVAAALYTTMRKGELVDWRRDDVDLVRRVFHVRSSRGRGVTKNGTHREELPIHSELHPFLAEQLASHSSEWVFPDKHGRRRPYGWDLAAVVSRALRRAGIHGADGRVRVVNFHGLRRVAATLYKQAGTDNLVRKLLMGHAIRDITDEAYTELDGRFMRREVERMSLTEKGSRFRSRPQEKRVRTSNPKVARSSRAGRNVEESHGVTVPLDSAWRDYASRLRERFSAHVERGTPDACWTWRGVRNAEGYGTLKAAGRRQYAHRLAYELGVGPLAEGQVVYHACGRRACVNPAHLLAGTQSEVRAGVVRRGRHAQGEQNGRAKLNPAKVRAIRRRLAEGESQANLARAYGVSDRAIRFVESGTSWKSVGGAR